MKQSIIEFSGLAKILDEMIKLDLPHVDKAVLAEQRDLLGSWVCDDIAAYVDALVVRRKQTADRIQEAQQQALAEAIQAEEDALTEDEQAEADVEQRTERLREGVS